MPLHFFEASPIDIIFGTLTAKWKKQLLTDAQQRAAWNEYVPQHLLPRLHGYELMMAPYAIAHMKMGLKLYESGYRFGSNERARIYLTNALEPASDDKEQREFEQWAPALAHEANAVNAIKRDQRFTVIVGNPPYSVNSANKSSPIDTALAAYKEGLDDERNLKPINDDYVKFLRCSQLILGRAGAGLLGMITNHSYASARLFRSMRRCLMREYHTLHFLDLRGETSRDPSMVEDQNVFAIQQGVGISLFVLDGAMPKSATGVLLHELVGSQETKYFWLTTHSLSTTPWNKVNPRPKLYSFGVVSETIDDEYRTFVPINRLFLVGNVGYQTHRDEFVIDADRDALIARMRRFRDHPGSELELSKSFDVRSNRDWSLLAAHRELRKEKHIEQLVENTLYRPFDIRHIAYASYLIDYDRRDLMRHMQNHNVGLLISKVFDEHEFTSVFATKWIVESKVADRTRGAYLFPLRLSDITGDLLSQTETRGKWKTNIVAKYLAEINERLRTDIVATNDRADGVADIDIFHYLYAALYSPGYRRRYAEFLKIDFPRLPFTGNVELFREMARLGGELVGLHLLESPKLKKLLTAYAGSANPEVEKISHARDTVWFDRAQTRGFRGVPDAVWNFHIGGYQVCEKWLKDRKGRTLSRDDIAHYQKVVVALTETIRLMKEIDEVIEKHGGWPGAFPSAKNNSQK